MNYEKPEILSAVPARDLIMGNEKGIAAQDNDVSNPNLATTGAYEADE